MSSRIQCLPALARQTKGSGGHPDTPLLAPEPHPVQAEPGYARGDPGREVESRQRKGTSPAEEPVSGPGVRAGKSLPPAQLGRSAEQAPWSWRQGAGACLVVSQAAGVEAPQVSWGCSLLRLKEMFQRPLPSLPRPASTENCVCRVGRHGPVMVAPPTLLAHPLQWGDAALSLLGLGAHTLREPLSAPPPLPG